MFTGIIEAVGEVEGIQPAGDGVLLRVRAGVASGGVGLGDSVAVNGACLTVTQVDGDLLEFDAVRETLDCTAIGGLEVGARVNLERAMLAGGRLDGHIVQGHVDGVGNVKELRQQGQDVQLLIDCEPRIAEFLVDKGSVTVDGVSLTVVTAQPSGFDVVLIPTTLAETTLGEATPGRAVNLEVDILGKYVKTYLERTHSVEAR